MRAPAAPQAVIEDHDDRLGTRVASPAQSNRHVHGLPSVRVVGCSVVGGGPNPACPVGGRGRADPSKKSEEQESVQRIPALRLL